MPCPIKLRKELLIKQNNRCGLCGLKPWAIENKSFHAHRIIPGRRGGKYIKNNVYLLCPGCHIKAEGLSREELLLLEPYLEPPLGVESN